MSNFWRAIQRRIPGQKVVAVVGSAFVVVTGLSSGASAEEAPAQKEVEAGERMRALHDYYDDNISSHTVKELQELLSD